jgi:hypothetical protein
MRPAATLLTKHFSELAHAQRLQTMPMPQQVGHPLILLLTPECPGPQAFSHANERKSTSTQTRAAVSLHIRDKGLEQLRVC